MAMNEQEIARHVFDYVVNSSEGSERMRKFITAHIKPLPSILEVLQMDPEQQDKAIEQYKHQKRKTAEAFIHVVEGVPLQG